MFALALSATWLSSASASDLVEAVFLHHPLDQLDVRGAERVDQRSPAERPIARSPDR
jgi:hypothetical protein